MVTETVVTLGLGGSRMAQEPPQPASSPSDPSHETTAPERRLDRLAIQAALGRLSLWLLFVVTLGLTPVIIKLGRTRSLDDVMADGELLILSAVFVAAAGGELTVRPPIIIRSAIVRAILIGACFVVACIASGWYANINTLQSANLPMNIHDIGTETRLVMGLVYSLGVAVLSYLISSSPKEGVSFRILRTMALEGLDGSG